MKKVVYNNCFGGFALSIKAAERLIELGYNEANFLEEVERRKADTTGFSYIYGLDILRHNSLLVQVVEELGKEVNGEFADLQIAALNGNKYIIRDYDGLESVLEPENIKWIIVDDKTT